MIKYVLFGTLALTAQSIEAQECMALKGNVINPLSFEQLQLAMPKIPKKDEFETTAQYNARVAESGAKAPTGPMFINLEAQFKSSYLQYDADRSVFSISAFDFNGGYFNSSLSGFRGPYKSSSYKERLVGVLVSRNVELEDSYTATNGYGAKVEVQKRIISKYELVEGNKKFKFNQSALWDGKSIGEVGTLAVPPELARDIKQRLKSAVMFIPKEPFIIKNISFGSSPTRKSPYKDTIITSALVGDIKCAVIYDNADNSVQWAYATR